MLTPFRRHTSRGSGRRLARPLVAASLCAALVAATPVTAHAETVDDADAVGDMVMLTFTEDEVILNPVPERTLNDVSRTRLRHAVRRVMIRVDYVDLKKKAGESPQVLDLAMVTDEGVRRHLQLAAYPRHWFGVTRMYTGNWRVFRCPVRHSIDYENNVTKVSFPRRCAGNPRWVQFRVGSYVEGEEVVIDDALRDRPMTELRFKRSERVHRESAR